MAKRYTVIGSSIASKFDYVEEKFGAEARAKLEARFRERIPLPVEAEAWYSFDLYVEVIEAVAEMFLEGDATKLADVGNYAARQSLRGIAQSFVHGKEKNFLDFLGRISALYSMFYSRGKLEVSVRQDGKGCELRHRDTPVVREADLHVARGFYEEAARLHEIDTIACTFSLEEDHVRFRLTWD